MEDLFPNPEKYKNSIIINLHGELMPFPLLRNYSDPAKDPENYPGVRVVTHPEKLKYNVNEDVKLRVYGYLMPVYSSPDNVDITVLLRGVNLDVNNDGNIDDISIEFIKGDGNTKYEKISALYGTNYNTSILYDTSGVLIGTKMLC